MDGHNFHIVKENLKEEMEQDKGSTNHFTGTQTKVLPIIHNHDHIFLQFCGWGIHLDIDGTWHWECTLGG